MVVYIETLGCPKNSADSANMAAVLEGGGNRITEDPGKADVLIVNTCAFINDAKEESIAAIFEMAELKEAHKGKILAVTGCLPQRYSEELFKELPEADIFIGVNEYGSINEILSEYIAQKRLLKVGKAPDVYSELPYSSEIKSGATAYLKIAEGCDNSCSYCIIPYIRGPYRSRKQEDIISEAESLADAGVKELVLIAQDTTVYGKDIYGEYALSRLLNRLCEIEGIHWIRLLYCYEDSITDELIETVKSQDKICKYMDIPLQHINDRVLSDMNRRSTSDSIKKTIARLRGAIPEIHIRTTFIAGFPGETEEEFEELEEFIRDTRFDRLGVFAYSQEENTAAGEMDDQLDEKTKEERRDALMELQRGISLELNREKIGQIIEVLAEEKEDDGTWIGRTAFDAPEIDNGVIFEADSEIRPGSFVKVKITDAYDYDLTGVTV